MKTQILVDMLSSAHLPAVHQQGGQSEGENEAQSLEASPQKVTMGTNELEDEGKFEVRLQQWSAKPQDAIMTDQGLVEEQSQDQASDETPDVEITSSRTLRSTTKRQEKTVKSRNPRIKGHEAKAESVEELLADTELLRSQMQDAKEELAGMKKDFKDKKAQLTANKKLLAACRRELNESKGVGRGIRKVNSDLRNELTASGKELSKCKDELFRLQRVAQIPDSTILRSFETVSQQIVHWIDAEIAAAEKGHPEAGPDHVFSVGEDINATEFLRCHPGAGEQLARYLIHHFLHDNVFGRNAYFFGLPEETGRLLWKTELQMAETEPRKGM